MRLYYKLLLTLDPVIAFLKPMIIKTKLVFQQNGKLGCPRYKLQWGRGGTNIYANSFQIFQHLFKSFQNHSYFTLVVI